MNKSKRLVILGAAESGVGAALLGKQQGWEVFVSDGGILKDVYKAVLEDAGIDYEEEGHTEANILNADCIVKSPGIPEKAGIMKSLRAAGLDVCSEIEFGFRYKGEGKIIAITGTNGKSTTTQLTYHLLKDAGLDVMGHGCDASAVQGKFHGRLIAARGVMRHPRGTGPRKVSRPHGVGRQPKDFLFVDGVGHERS